MSFETNRQDITVHETLYADTVTELVEGDIIVPDVKADVAKILQIDGTTAIESREYAGGKVTLNGCVYLTILYTPTDGSKIEAIRTSMEYSHTIKAGSAEDALYASAGCDVANIDYNLYNSRKLNVKTTVAIDVKVTAKRSVTMVTGCEADCPVEMQSRQVQTIAADMQTNDVIAIKEAFDIPNGMPNIGRILKCDTQFKDQDYKVLAGKVVVKGEIGITTLYLSEEGEIEFMEHSLPFTEIIDANGIDEDMEADVTLVLSNLAYQATEDSDGDMRVLFIDTRMYVDINAYQKEMADVLSDAFCTDFPLDMQWGSFTYTHVGDTLRVPVTIKEVLRIDSELPPIRQVYSLLIKPYINESQIQNGQMVIDGVADVYILYLCEDDQTPLYSVRQEIPFSLTEELEDAGGDYADIRVTAEHCSYNITAGGDIEVRCIINVTAKAMQTISTNFVESVTPAEVDEEEGPKPSLVIYFAQKGDTLWDIAKSYSVTQENISRANKIVDGYIKAGQKIVIPR